MKVLLLSYGCYEYDGRLRELINVSKSLGDTKYITRVNSHDNKQEINHETFLSEGFFDYLKFIIKCLIIASKLGKIDVLFIDNRKAVIPGIIIRTLKKPRYTIQDVRELYLINEVEHLSGKIGCLFENYMIKRANIVICANKHRAEIMKDYYKLKKMPLVYENIRKIEYTDKLTMEDLNIKYGHYFNKTTMKIISTSGTDISRTNDILVKAMLELGDGYELFLIGGGTKNDTRRITNIIEENDLKNVHLIGKLNTAELKYFLQRSNIGIVNYHQKNTNNKYCASGKLFEFLFEEIPVVTTENVPLKEMCSKYKIGISDNGYVQAIRKVANEYRYYKNNVIKYISKFDVRENNNDLIREISLLIKND